MRECDAELMWGGQSVNNQRKCVVKSLFHIQNLQYFDHIEYSKEQNMNSSDQYLSSANYPPAHEQPNPSNRKKQKKIKKRKNNRINSNPSLPEDTTHLQQFLSSSGNQYFSQSKQQLADQFCYNFKSNMHIKSIIGNEDNVYNLKKTEGAMDDAMQYLRLISSRQRGRLAKVLLSNQKCKKTLKYIHSSRQNRNVLLLDKQEAALLAKRQLMHQQMEHFFKHNLANGSLDIITTELLTLCKLNTNQENDIMEKIYHSANNGSNVLNRAHQDTFQRFQQYEDDYLGCLVRKNVAKGLDESPVDMLNYFNCIEAEERTGDNDEPVRLFSNLDAFKCYLKFKKPKFGKPAEQSLKTCCSACFSNYYEVMNPLETCSECGMRMHRLCQTIRSKCQRCKYIRKTLQEKSSIPYCLVCQRQKEQNLSIQFIYDGAKQYYAHTFCLLTTHSWSFSNKQTHYHMPRPDSDIVQTCRICNTSNSFCITCKCCNSKMHGLCAFLEGYSLSMNIGGRLEVERCGDESNNHRVSLLRKFKVNYEKILYKNNEQLFSMIQSQQ